MYTHQLTNPDEFHMHQPPSSCFFVIFHFSDSTEALLTVLPLPPFLFLHSPFKIVTSVQIEVEFSSHWALYRFEYSDIIQTQYGMLLVKSILSILTSVQFCLFSQDLQIFLNTYLIKGSHMKQKHYLGKSHRKILLQIVLQMK